MIISSLSPLLRSEPCIQCIYINHREMYYMYVYSPIMHLFEGSRYDHTVKSGWRTGFYCSNKDGMLKRLKKIKDTHLQPKFVKYS